jgi:hypothetical protein
MRIRVTQEHIDRGFRWNCDSCPITLAILERFPGWYVQTTPVDVRFRRYGEPFHPPTPLPPIAKDFIQNLDSYDVYRTVSPIEFDLIIPESVLDQIK